MINYILYFQNNTGGLENFSEDLLIKLKTLDIEIKILSPKTNYRLLNIIYYLYLLRSTNSVTLVHYGNFTDVIFIKVLSMLKIKTLVICHVGRSWKHIKNIYLNRVTNNYLKSTNTKILTIAEDQRDFLNITTYKIPTIINSSFFNIKHKKYNSDYLLFIGRVSKDKGIINLLKSYNNLLKNNKNIPKLVVVGPFQNESYKKLCYDYCNKNNLDAFVDFVGPVYDIKKKIDLIDRCLFGVYPSFYDAFPLTLLEFYSRKKILLCSNISESRIFIDDKSLLIDPFNINDITNKMRNICNFKESEYINIVKPFYIKSKKYDGLELAKKINKFSNDLFQ
jgi:glycosyltransferase involved in cell wall biosynthesis